MVEEKRGKYARAQLSCYLAYLTVAKSRRVVPPWLLPGRRNSVARGAAGGIETLLFPRFFSFLLKLFLFSCFIRFLFHVLLNTLPFSHNYPPYQR